MAETTVSYFRGSFDHADRCKKKGLTHAKRNSLGASSRTSPVRYAPYEPSRLRKLFSMVESVLTEIESISDYKEKIRLLELALRKVKSFDAKIKLLSRMAELHYDQALIADASNKPKLLELTANTYKELRILTSDEKDKISLFEKIEKILIEAINLTTDINEKNRLKELLKEHYQKISEELFQIAVAKNPAEERLDYAYKIAKYLLKVFNMCDNTLDNFEYFFTKIANSCLLLAENSQIKRDKQIIISLAINSLFKIAVFSNVEKKINYLSQIKDCLLRLYEVNPYPELLLKIEVIKNQIIAICDKLRTVSDISVVNKEIQFLFQNIEKELIDITTIINLQEESVKDVPSLAFLDIQTKELNEVLSKIPLDGNYYDVLQLTVTYLIELLGTKLDSLKTMSYEEITLKMLMLYRSLEILDTFYLNTKEAKRYFEAKIMLFNAIYILEDKIKKSLLPLFSEKQKIFNFVVSKPVVIYRKKVLKVKNALRVFDQVYCFANYYAQEPLSLGEGTYGRVRLMIDTSSHTDMVVKKTNLKSWGNFFDFYAEYRISKMFINPHVLSYLDFGIYQGKKHNAFCIMPRCKAFKPTVISDRDKLLQELKKIAETIKLFHEHGIVYNDCKIANIIEDIVTGELKITDFGLSLPREKSLMPVSYVFGGTFYPPEKIPIKFKTGIIPSDYDLATLDVWSFGVMLLNILGFEVDSSIDHNPKHREEIGPNKNGVFIWLEKAMDFISTQIAPADPKLATLLFGCLDPDYHNRWTMDQIVACWP